MNFQPRPILPAAIEVGAPPQTCQWPLWNDQERATHKYCGAAVAKERPYCPHHTSIAYYNPGAPPKLDYLLRERALPEDAAPLVPVMTKVVIRKPKAPKAPKPPKLPGKKKRGRYFRQLPPIPVELCINDAERRIVTMWNSGKSQRDIARELGCTHSSVAGRCSRIRARRLEE